MGLDGTAVSLDAAAFERLIDRGTASALVEAIDLYRGDLLAGFGVQEAPFEDWLQGERERLREKALGALERLLAEHAEKVPAAAIDTALRLLTLDPARESCHRALMRLYAEQGRESAALRQYEVCARALERELGVAPQAETRRLYQEILRRHRPDRATARPKAAVEPPAPDPPTSDTSLIGRDAELRALDDALARAIEGAPSIVAVLGEAGIGKTRLVEELAVMARRRGAVILSGHCHDTEQILALGPWAEAMRSGSTPADFDGLDAPWRRALAHLLPDLLAPERPDATAADDPLLLFEAVAHWLGRIGARQPLVLVLEDLQWADEMSVRLLSFVAHRLRSTPMLIVTTLRTEELDDNPLFRRLVAALLREQRLVRVTLAPLSHGHTLELVSALGASPARAVPATRRLGEDVWAISHGHPLMTVEAVRAVQQGAVIGAAGGALAIPRVTDLISARLGRLRPPSRQLASVVAVAGRPCAFAVLRVAAGVTEPEAAAAVEELVRRRVLKAVDGDLDFTHERIRDVVYTDLLPPIRKALHGAVARALETVYADDLDPHWGALALHHAENDAWEAAGRCFRRAGAHAARRAAHREATRCYEQALAMLSRLPPIRERLEEAVDLRFDLRNSLTPLGDVAGVTAHLAEADRVATMLDDLARMGWVSSFTAFHASLTGDLRRAVEAGERARALGSRVDDFRLQVHANYCLGVAYYSLGDYRSAAEVARINIASLHGERLREGAGGATLPSVTARAYLALCLSELGEFAESAGSAAEARRLAVEFDHRYSTAVASLAVGLVEIGRGDPVSAVAPLAEGVALCRAGEFAVLQPYLTSALGLAHALSGNVEGALPLLLEAVEEARARDLRLWQSRHTLWLAVGFLRAGRRDEARERAERALRLAREQQESGIEAWTLCLLGEIGNRGPDEAGAARCFDEALAMAEARGMRPLMARCRLGLGMLHAARGG